MLIARTALPVSLAVTLVLSPVPGRAQLPDSTRTRVDAVFSRWDRTDSPGCSLGISQDGRPVYERGYGMSDMQHALAITPGSIFHVASISKEFSAYAIALLAAEGRLTLDDDIRRYVPEVPDYGPRITIRNLIHHTSGLRDQWQLLAYAGWRDDDVITEGDVLAIVARQRGLNFKPGDEWIYSNTGYTLLAVIVKRASGQSLREFAQARIFAPLGMRDTHFHDDHTMIVPGRTSAYQPRDGGGWQISIPVFDTYGATSLFTTSLDLLKWMANLDHPTVGTAALVAAAQTSGVLNDGTPTGYGYGLTVGSYRGLKAIGHGGADAGYRAQVERYPERGIAVAVLCNASSAVPSVLLRRVTDVLLGTSAPPQVASIDTVTRPVAVALKQPWVGVYRDTLTQQVMRIRLTNDTLRLQDGRMLATTSDTSARIGNSASALVLRSVGGVVTAVQQLPRSTRDLVFRREVAFTPDRAALAAFAGTYESDELDVRYTLAVTDSGLVVRHRKLGEMLMVPTWRDAFTVHYNFFCQFTRDRSGKVTGFSINDGRVRGVRFDRVK
ncbi:MAG: serine hydrolase domain-containing protein [Gemmatimonadota bacterium]